MDTGTIIAICSFVGGIILGVIGFFLKRAFTQLDDKASKQSVCELDDRIKKTEKSIDDVKANYLTKDDFYREQAKTDRKLEQIIRILMEIKGGRRNG